jgi:Protein of unknown function (DUF1569)
MKTLAHTGDKAEILRRLKTVGPESSRRWGRMSAPQMVCHLSDSFRMCLGEKEVRPTNSRLDRTIVKALALYLPIPWLRGIHTSPELAQECGGTKPADFAADLAELATLLEVVTTPPLRFSGRSHPIFGRMSDAAWLRWGYLHMDHHLRQFGA